MVKQAVQDGRGDDRVAEELLPLREALVRGDYSAGPFVPVGDELTGRFLVLLQPPYEAGHGREVHARAGVAGLDSQSGGQVRFAGTRRPKETFTSGGT